MVYSVSYAWTWASSQVWRQSTLDESWIDDRVILNGWWGRGGNLLFKEGVSMALSFEYGALVGII